MIILNEKMKKALKITGVICGAFIFLGFFNLFIGNGRESQMPMSKIGSLSVDNINTSSSRGVAVGGDTYQENLSAPMVMDGVNSPESASSIPEQADKKIIKNGNLILKVEKTENAVEEISTIVKDRGGEIFSTNFNERVKGQKSGSVIVKVPVQKFEETIGEIKKVATQVISESTAGQDVTEQYADLQAQVNNKRAEEESFVKILDRAGEISDVLAVTQQVARVRGEIDRLEGKIKFMEAQTDMSTITVNLSEDIEVAPITNDWRPWQVVKKSFGELIDNVQVFVNSLIKFAIVTLPALIVFSLIIWIVVIVAKKVYKKIFNGNNSY